MARTRQKLGGADGPAKNRAPPADTCVVTSGTVLVVEDDTDIQRLVRLLLERAGFAVRGAASGHDALRILFSEQPDLVMLDIGLPGMDGWQVLERVRDLSDVPVLMLTAQGDERVGSDVGACGEREGGGAGRRVLQPDDRGAGGCGAAGRVEPRRGRL